MNTRRAAYLVKSLILGAGLIKAANFLCMPFLALFLAKKSALNPFEIGLIIGLSPLAAVLGAFFGGPLSDILGRKRILLGSLLLTTLVFAGFYLAAKSETSKLQILLFCIFNLLNGLGTWMYQPVSQALIGDLLKQDQRQHAYQLRYTMINLGAAIGPILGAFMGATSSPQGFAVTGIFYLLYFIWNAFLLNGLKINETNPRNKPTIKLAVQVLTEDRRLRYFVLAGAVFMACYAQLESNLSQYLIRKFEDGATLFSAVLSLNGIAVLIFQAPVYFISKKITPTKSLISGSLLFSTGLMLIALSEAGRTGIYAGMVLVSVGEIFVFPVSSYFVDSIAPDHLRGTYFGASVIRQLGLSLGPAAGGLILESVGVKYLFIVASFLAATGVLIHLQGEKIAVHHQTQENAYG